MGGTWADFQGYQKGSRTKMNDYESLQRQNRRLTTLVDDLLNERDAHLSELERLREQIALARSNPDFLHSEERSRA